tara:strand:- start:25360 stop:26103 length:744 start_codon:yes stop_codon:yes gene_type:complete
MELNDILKVCLNYGFLKFEVHGEIVYPKDYYIHGDQVVLNGEHFYKKDVKILSIDIDKLREANELFSFILEFNDDSGVDGIDLSDLSKISSLFILKKLKNASNDIEKLDILSKYLDTKYSLVDELVEKEEIDKIDSSIGYRNVREVDLHDDLDDLADFGYDECEDECVEECVEAELEINEEDELDFNPIRPDQNIFNNLVNRDYYTNSNFQEKIEELCLNFHGIENNIETQRELYETIRKYMNDNNI